MIDPLEAETVSAIEGTIYINGTFSDRDDASSYQKLVRCTTQDCHHAFMFSRADGWKEYPTW